MKMYFIKYDVIVQSERMGDKLRFLVEDVERKLIFNECEECEIVVLQEKLENYEKQLEQYEKAKDNLRCEGYSYKGYWDDIKVLKAFASQRDMLDSCMV